MDCIANMESGLDPNNSVIKRFWCTRFYANPGFAAEDSLRFETPDLGSEGIVRAICVAKPNGLVSCTVFVCLI